MHLCGLSYASRRKRDENYFTEAREERKGKDRLLSYRVLSRVFAWLPRRSSHRMCSNFIRTCGEPPASTQSAIKLLPSSITPASNKLPLNSFPLTKLSLVLGEPHASPSLSTKMATSTFLRRLIYVAPKALLSKTIRL